jgi:hypothetical protein
MQLKVIGRFALLTIALTGFVTITSALTAQTPVKRQTIHFTATTENVSGSGEMVKINLVGWSTDAERDQLLAAWTLAPAPGAAARGGGARGAGGRGAGGGRGARGAAPAGDDTATGDDTTVVDDGAGAAAAAGRGARGGRGRGAAGPAVAETPESSLMAALQKTPTVGLLWTSETTGYSVHYAYRFPQPDGGERIILATDRRLGVGNSLWKPAGAAKPTDYEFSVIELRLNAKGEGEGKMSLTGKVAVDKDAKTIALDGYSTLPVVLKGVKRQ